MLKLEPSIEFRCAHRQHKRKHGYNGIIHINGFAIWRCEHFHRSRLAAYDCAAEALSSPSNTELGKKLSIELELHNALKAPAADSANDVQD